MKIKLKLLLLQAYWNAYRRLFPPKIPKNADGKVYLNLGSGNKTGPEFINIDTAILPNIHYISDITDLHSFSNNSIDMIYACHLVEHIPRSKLISTISEWKRVLKNGGIFRFAVPDFDMLLAVYTESGKNISSIENQLMGQDAPYHNHCSIWNKNYAEKILKEVGFSSIRLWNPETSEHHNFKDKSSRIMTIGNKNIPISLNIEAIK